MFDTHEFFEWLIVKLFYKRSRESPMLIFSGSWFNLPLLAFQGRYISTGVTYTERMRCTRLNVCSPCGSIACEIQVVVIV